MSKHHESIHGERLAMGWHLVWAVLCLNTLCFSLGVIAMVWPYISVGKALLALACALVGQCVMSAGGVLWHVFGAMEHKRAIARLGKPECRYCDRAIEFLAVLGSPAWFHRTARGLRRDCGESTKATPKVIA